MPFVNESSARENTQRFEQSDGYEEASSFGDTYGASLGMVFDEELSISSQLNMEGTRHRNYQIDSLARQGAIDLDKYRNLPANHRTSTVDYGAAAKELNRDDIKTDEVLNQERNDLLAQRRGYAQDVIDRGSGTAQFLGAATGYVLDPINIATMGIATPITAGRAITTIGRAALAAKDTALIVGATELGIQALVYQHKQDIDSPYSAGDALAAIGMAATGAAALGGAAGGLAAYFDRVLKLSDQVPQTKDVIAAKEYIERNKSLLKGAPEADTPEAQIQSDVDHLAEMNNRAEQYSAPSKTPDQYAEPERSTAAVSQQQASSTIAENTDDIGQALQQRVDGDFETLAKEYEALDTSGGKILNTDTARELSPEYLTDRTRAAEVHQASTDFIDRLYKLKLAEAPGPNERPNVIFAAGGTGAGKTTALGDASINDAQLVYDGTFKDFSKAKARIDEALAHEKNALVNLVLRDPLEALDGALQRAERQRKQFGTGRTTPLSVFIKSHQQAPQTVLQLSKEYANNPRVNFSVLDNNSGAGKAKPVPIEALNDLNYTSLADDASKLLERRLKDGSISEETYQGFKAAEQSRGSRDQSPSGQGQPTNARQPEQSDTGTGPQTSPRELDIVQRQGLAQAYEDDLKAFNTIDNPTVFVDGEAVDAKALIKQFDDELDGIESVLRCAYG